MNYISKCKSVLMLSSIVLSQTAAALGLMTEELPLQSQSPIPLKAKASLTRGTTAHIAADWNGDGLSARRRGVPDSSFRTVWVRMFPLLSVPLSDPYPQTQDLNNIEIQSDRGLDISYLESGESIGSTNSLRLDFSKTTFVLNGVLMPMKALWITPKEGGLTTLLWDQTAKLPNGSPADVGVKVAGGVVINKTVVEMADNGKPKASRHLVWSAINIVDVDQYLLSVVPSEALSTWHSAALQAQAIAARTYLLYEMASSRQAGKNWDVDPTTWYQCYRGSEFWGRDSRIWRSVETAATSAAVVATARQVVVYGTEVIQAYFSANSGGVTCSVQECFNQPDLPYLSAIEDAAGIKNVAGGTWGANANITSQSITEVLRTLEIIPPSPVRSLSSLSSGPTGRVWQLRVHLQSGHIDLNTQQTRKIMRLFGPIRSFLYSLQEVQSDGKQTVVGHGYGHGVGMSQWGAQIFAGNGWSAQRILRYYYMNTEIKTL